MSSKVIVVLGSGRSGTSLITQLLHRCGMDVSDHLIGHSEQNPMGAWEDEGIFQVVDTLYNELHTTTRIPLFLGWEKSETARKAKQLLIDIVKKNAESAKRIWGFKNPRTAEVLPLFTQVFNACRITPIYVLIVRAPHSVVQSMNIQYGVSTELAELFWLFKYCDAVYYTGARFFLIHYEDIMNRNLETFKQLVQYVGLRENMTDDDLSNILAQYVRPDLDRSSYLKSDIRNEHVKILYDALKKSTGAEFDRPALQRTVNDIRNYMRPSHVWMSEQNRIHQIRLGSLKANRGGVPEKLQTEQDSLKKLHQDTDERLQEFENKTHTETESLKQKLVDLQAQIEQLTSTNTLMERELEDAVQEESLLLKQIRELKGELEQSFEEIDRFKNKARHAERKTKRVHELEDSYAFRIGNAIVSAFTSPGKNTVFMPFRIIKLLSQACINNIRK